jgi:hypothetical protein
MGEHDIEEGITSRGKEAPPEVLTLGDSNDLADAPTEFAIPSQRMIRDEFKYPSTSYDNFPGLGLGSESAKLDSPLQLAREKLNREILVSVAADLIIAGVQDGGGGDKANYFELGRIIADRIRRFTEGAIQSV